MITLTPDKLFHKFITISTSPPTDGTNWPTILCNVFYNALTQRLSDAMADNNNFTLPHLVGLTTESK